MLFLFVGKVTINSNLEWKIFLTPNFVNIFEVLNYILRMGVTV